MKKLTLLIIFLLLQLPIFVCAQYSIKGVVVNESQEPLEAVNVVLLNKDSVVEKAASSDNNGFFEIKGITFGDYLLQVSSVGYRSFNYVISRISKAMDMGTIVMEEEVVLLDEVAVQARASLTKADRIILFPSNKQIESSANSIVLLSSLAVPRLIVNQATNTVSLPGNEAVELRINNVVVGNDELRALPPNTIERIEYIDNPGLRYGNAKAVINYITKRQLTGGNVRLDLTNSPMRVYGSDLISAKFNYKKSEFGLSYMNDFRDYYNYERSNHEIFNFPNEVLIREEESLRGRDADVYQNIALNYNLTDKKTFMNITFRYQDLKIPHKDFDARIKMSDVPENPIYMTDYTSDKVHLPSLDFYLEKTLTEKQKMSLNIVSTARFEYLNRKYEEHNDISDYYLKTDLESDAYSLIGEGIYENSIGKGKLNIGIKHFQKWTNNDYLIEDLVNSKMKQSETYLYSEYIGNIQRLNYTIGIGGKRSWYSQNGGESEYAYYNFQPTLSLHYKIKDNFSVRYRLNMYNNVPTLSQLTNVDMIIDSLQIRRGNPDLKPGMSYQNVVMSDFTINKLYLSARIEHWYSPDFIQDKTFFENNKIVRGYTNVDRFKRLTCDIYSRLSLFKDKLVLAANIGMHRYSIGGYDIY